MKNKLLKFTIVLACFNVFPESNEPIAISLGTYCAIANALKYNGIRNQAYPFDWLVIPFDGLYKVLDSDFEFFLSNKNTLQILDKDKRFVVDASTDIYYGHDFPTEGGRINANVVGDFLSYFDRVKEKYTRRINRLKMVLNSSKRVMFFRYMINKQEAIALCNLLKQKFKLLDFSIVAINTTHEQWNVNQVKNVYLPYELTSEPKSQEWYKIFHDVGLIENANLAGNLKSIKYPKNM